MPRRPTNRGWFRPGRDPRRSGYQFTRDDCKKGFLAALESLQERGYDVWWLYGRLADHYGPKFYPRAKRRKSDGQEP